MNTVKRYDLLDGLRGVAAIAVALYHITQRSDFPLFVNASSAVDMFFMLSGFVIAYSYGEKLINGMKISTYLSMRFIRLYPLFLFGLLIGFIPPILSQADTVKNLISVFIINSLFLPDFFSAYGENLNFLEEIKKNKPVFPYNAPLWSLFFEMFASLIFIGLNLVRDRYLLIKVVFSFSLLFWFGINYGNHSTYVDFTAGYGTYNFLGGLPRVLYGFGLGILIFRSVEKFQDLKILTFVTRFSFSTYVLLGFTIAVFLFPIRFSGWYFLLAILLMMPLVVILASVCEVKSDFQRKICSYLGELSFPLYCIHIPLLHTCEIIFPSYVDGIRTSTEAVFVSFLSSVGLSCILIKFYDRPVRATLKRYMIKQ